MSGIFESSREYPFTPDQIFAAIRDPQRLARWWGPDGFTNTFDVFEFRIGGRWNFTMHGPDGANYRNESVFAEIDPPGRWAVDHVSEPRFRLTLTLAPTPTGSRLNWVQAFENPEVGKKLESIIRPANEQNLDRLHAELRRGAPSGS